MSPYLYISNLILYWFQTTIVQFLDLLKYVPFISQSLGNCFCARLSSMSLIHFLNSLSVFDEKFALLLNLFNFKIFQWLGQSYVYYFSVFFSWIVVVIQSLGFKRIVANFLLLLTITSALSIGCEKADTKLLLLPATQLCGTGARVRESILFSLHSLHSGA